ncbi:uncharacterized protein LOC135829896 [Sycon ciliatum]|uniref:uncharacterized protein LOC135829896 n=1 Tax=Sycon ciliatum TaxID=27933 RepID=UPI0031F6CDF3
MEEEREKGSACGEYSAETETATAASMSEPTGEDGAGSGEPTEGMESLIMKLKSDKIQLKRNLTNTRRGLTIGMRDNEVDAVGAGHLYDELRCCEQAVTAVLSELKRKYEFVNDKRNVIRTLEEMEEVDRDVQTAIDRYDEFVELWTARAKQYGQAQAAQSQFERGESFPLLGVDEFGLRQGSRSTSRVGLRQMQSELSALTMETDRRTGLLLERSPSRRTPRGFSTDDSKDTAAEETDTSPKPGEQGADQTENSLPPAHTTESVTSLPSSSHSVQSSITSCTTTAQHVPVTSSSVTRPIPSSGQAVPVKDHVSLVKSSTSQPSSLASIHARLAGPSSGHVGKSVLSVGSFPGHPGASLNFQAPAFQPAAQPVSSRAPVYGTGLPSSDVFGRLKKVAVPTFSGDVRMYETWKAAFMACIDAAPVSPQLKLLQLRQYVTGEALRAIEQLGYTAEAYRISLERLERKFGGQRRQVAIQLETLEAFQPIQRYNPQALEKFADLLEIAVVNLKDAGRHMELQNGTFFSRLLSKLTKQMVAQYQRWLYEHQQTEDVLSLLKWVTLEAEFQTTATKIVDGIQKSASSRPSSHRSLQQRNAHTHLADGQTARDEETSFISSRATCPECSGSHGIWECSTFKGHDTGQRWTRAKELSLCYRCLGTGHRGDKCPRTRTCGVDGCQRNHHRLLHGLARSDFEIRKKPRADGKERSYDKANTKAEQGHCGVATALETPTEGESPQQCSNATAETSYTSLRTVPVVLRSGSKRLVVNALLDDGSTNTFIHEDVATALGMSGEQHDMTINMLNGKRSTFKSMEVEFDIANINGQSRTTVVGLTTPNQVTGRLQLTDWSSKKIGYEHLADIPFPEPATPERIELLIGVDNAELHRALYEVSGPAGEPIARLTPLGWTCVGAGVSRGGGTNHCCSAIIASSETLLSVDKTLRQFWEIEQMTSPEHPMSPENLDVLTATKKRMTFTNGRYCVGMPWRADASRPTNNYDMAAKRLAQTQKRLKRVPEIAERYAETIESYVRKGYVVKVNANPREAGSWLLPHFPVVRLDKSTTKVRIVFDGSAKHDGTALNDLLHTGPKLQRDLSAVLLRFRRHPICIGCDVTEMYLQVEVRKSDRPYLRFLWNTDSQSAPDVYEFNRVVFGLNCSPFLAQLVAREHAKTLDPEFARAAEMMLESTYMDDGMDSVSTIAEGVALYKSVTAAWKGAGMAVRKWLSNAPELLGHIPREDQATQLSLNGDGPSQIKTLGISWLSDSDMFSFQAVIPPDDMMMTKRNILRKIATIFDPLGFLAPVIIRAKILMQEIWASGATWDEVLPVELSSRCRQWFQDLLALSSIQVPRCLQAIAGATPQDVELHVFGDASELAYGAVIYQRIRYASGEISTVFVSAKSRVSPTTATSIPRLELMAAVLGVEMANEVAKVLQINPQNIIYWTDSMDVIWWIRGRSRLFKTFVANRVSTIHQASSPDQWRYVPTAENPADIVSRGCAPTSLTPDSMWWTGPSFMAKPSDDWPVRQLPTAQAKETKSMKETVLMSSTETGTDDEGTGAAEPSVWRLEPQRYSDLERLIRVQAWVMRFLHNARTPHERRELGELTVDELSESELMLVKSAQESEFRDEIKAIKKGQPVSSQSKIAALHPQLDDSGLLRARSRLQYADFLPSDTISPIILPRTHPTTKLVITRIHGNGHHALGNNQVLNELVKRFWVVGAREAVKEVDRQCPECQRRKAKPAKQLMAPLPTLRIEPGTRAFERVGIDFAGPMYTKQGRRAQAKRWLCIFTCLATRAIHIEVAYGLDTGSFLNCFFRMVGRRGAPHEVLTDNGTNFVGAVTELRELRSELDEKKIIKATNGQRIQWHFNPPAAPHFGGPFEVMVKAAKRALYAILKSGDITDEELVTATIGAEHLINSRPLTTVSSDARDCTPISPSDLLLGDASHSIDVPGDDPAASLRRRWRRVQELVRHFWARWMQEWLPMLSGRAKWKKPYNNVQVGDVVILLAKDTPRGQWQLGRVVDVHPGRDGLVRVVDVKVKNTTLRRPISKICPLEAYQ